MQELALYKNFIINIMSLYSIVSLFMISFWK